MKRILFNFIIALIMVCTLAAICSTAAELPKINWVLQTTELTLTDARTNELVEFANRVSQRTDGKFNIRVTIAKELGIDRDEFSQAVARGQIEMAWVNTATAAATLPYITVMNLPYLTSGQDSTLSAIGAINDMVVEDMETLGYKPIPPNCFFTFGSQQLFSANPIQNLGNLSGLKIRVWRDVDAKIIKNLGGVPIYMPITEVYVAIQRGVLDGLVTGSNAMVSLSVWELGNSYYSVGLASGGAWIIVNQEKWDSLPSEYQKIVEEENITTLKAIYDGNMAAENKDQAKLVKNGVIINQPNEAEIKAWRDNARPIWEEWAQQDSQNRKVLDSILKALDL